MGKNDCRHCKQPLDDDADYQRRVCSGCMFDEDGDLNEEDGDDLFDTLFSPKRGNHGGR